MHRPIVIVPACTREIGVHLNHAVQHKYVDAVLLGADCMPLLLPAFGARTDWDAVLATADGVLLTGSPSNVHPQHFGEEVHNPSLPLDPERDATNLPLIRAAMARGIPLMAICRGFQEINVALGGSLHQAVQEVDGLEDHREDKSAALDQQYAARHPVSITPGGKLARILGADGTIMVNSLHGQGVARLAEGLVVEARAPDGLVEAYSVASARGFTLALQWHPEWKVTQNPDSAKLFAAFGDACRQYRLEKQK
jgi:putative glutamine amidotransferase